MSTKHTPGPWAEDGFGRIAATKSDQFNGGYFVAECEGTDKFANARLIAAAPDLLEALQQVLHHFVPEQGNLKVEQDVISNAHAAITKATGEQA